MGNCCQSFQTRTKAFGLGLPSLSPAHISAVAQSNYLQAHLSQHTVPQHALITAALGWAVCLPTWCWRQMKRGFEEKKKAKDVTSCHLKKGWFFHQCIILTITCFGLTVVLFPASSGSVLLGFALMKIRISTLVIRQSQILCFAHILQDIIKAYFYWILIHFSHSLMIRLNKWSICGLMALLCVSAWFSRVRRAQRWTTRGQSLPSRGQQLPGPADARGLVITALFPSHKALNISASVNATQYILCFQSVI